MQVCTRGVQGNVRELLKQFEGVNPQVVLNIVRSGDRIASTSGGCVDSSDQLHGYRKGECSRCGFITSNPDGLCKACLLLEGLNTENRCSDHWQEASDEA